MGSDKAAKPKVRSLSVTNAMCLIKIFLDDQHEMSIIDLSTRLHLPIATVHRLAGALIEAEMLEKNSETGKYRLGIALLELSIAMQT